MAHGSVNFYPNDRVGGGAPGLFQAVAEPPMPMEQEAAPGWFDPRDEDNFTQAGNLFRIMSESQRAQLFGNLAAGLGQANPTVQERLLAQFDEADPADGDGVRRALGG